MAKLLLTYADNILRNPSVEKYRSIRIGNPTFSIKLLPIKGAVECLFEMGFEEAETHLVFPQMASVQQLTLIRDSIAAERELRLSGGGGGAEGWASASLPLTSAVPSEPSTPVQPPLSLESSMNFLLTLQTNFQHVMVYENSELQRKALNCIPHQQLTNSATSRLKQARDSDPGCKLGLEDFLVLELLCWFKKDFFSWVDCLSCSGCNGPTQNQGSLSPSSEDLRWSAQRVEDHHCQACRLSTRFPRYNNPEKLLETRRGRCGEWANCFTLCCRAVGLEARYVWDSTDHVWTEVFSPSQRRWLHCDSCENVCDKPLLYEVGWNKKLSYVLAFSRDQVVDVTWRYSCKHNEVLTRRTKVQEAWLLHMIHGLNKTKQKSISPQRKKELTERLLVELVEFISPKTPKPGELSGRSSGSLTWRLARGETTPDTQVSGFVFFPTEAEQRDNVLHVKYSAATDQYSRLSNLCQVISGWAQCVWEQEGMFRKEERDWNMAYLCRTEGSCRGRVSWRVDLSVVGLKVRSVTVTAHTQTFESGSVLWRIQSGPITEEFTGDGRPHTVPALSGSSDFIIAAELSGGDGDVSWQHAQIFRQSLKEKNEASFEILVELEKV